MVPPRLICRVPKRGSGPGADVLRTLHRKGDPYEANESARFGDCGGRGLAVGDGSGTGPCRHRHRLSRLLPAVLSVSGLRAGVRGAAAGVRRAGTGLCAARRGRPARSGFLTSAAGDGGAPGRDAGLHSPGPATGARRPDLPSVPATRAVVSTDVGRSLAPSARGKGQGSASDEARAALVGCCVAFWVRSAPLTSLHEPDA